MACTATCPRRAADVGAATAAGLAHADPARALDREPAGGGRDRQSVRPLGGRPADLPQGARQGERDLAGGAEEPLHLPAAQRGQALGGGRRRHRRRLRGLPEEARRTVTFDRGTEFAGYAVLDRDLAVKAYFCDPHSPCQKGGVENLNGRARRFLPRESPPERSRAPACAGSPTGSTTRPDVHRLLRHRGKSSRSSLAPRARPPLTSPRTSRTSRRNRPTVEELRWRSSRSSGPTTRPGSSSGTATRRPPRSAPIRPASYPWPRKRRSVSHDRGPVQTAPSRIMHPLNVDRFRNKSEPIIPAVTNQIVSYAYRTPVAQ